MAEPHPERSAKNTYEIANDLKKSTYNGHLSADNHVHIHRHAGELYTAGTEGILSSLDPAGSTYDFVIENPSGSGNELEIIFFEPSSVSGVTIEHWSNVDFPGTGTAVTPVNLLGFTEDADSNVKHGDGIVDETTGTKVPESRVAGDKGSGSVFDVSGLDFALSPGQTLLVRFELLSTPSDTAISCVFAEYEEGRTFIDE